jgi:DNA-binding transcriptional LysR family regulator
VAVTLQQLRYLIAIADNGSLSAAARAEGVTQPVLSRSLASLQAELAAPLLHRHERKLVLTSQGLAALHSARQAVAAADDFRRAVRRHQ